MTIIAYLLGLFIGIIVGAFVAWHHVTFNFQSDAVEHGFAKYDSQTGVWKWKEK